MENASFARFPVSSVAGLLLNEYNITAADVTLMPGYDDTNYCVTTPTHTKYVLKMSPSDRADLTQVPTQIELLMRLKETEVGELIPGVVPRRDGKRWGVYEDGWVGRVMEYIEGELVGKAEIHSEEMWVEVGKTVGLLDRCLAGIECEEVGNKREVSMDIALSTLQTRLHYISTPSDTLCVQSLLSTYQLHVLPLLPSLPRQLIHNDLHDYNMLCSDGKVVGIIDYEDMEVGYRLVDLATMAGMTLMENEDVLDAVTPLIQGFHSVTPLTDQEIDCLLGFIAMRMGMFAVLAAMEKVERPGNEYLWVDDDLDWARVRTISRIDYSSFCRQLRSRLL